MSDVLVCDRLNAAYGESHILKDVSLRLRKGEVTAVMGRNGVGKTTLLKTIMGLVPARSGTISFEGDRIEQSATDARARRGIAYVPQGREILPRMSVYENLQLGLEVLPRGQRSIPESMVYSLFPILHEMRHRMGGNLSGGQQQQLSIARALVGNPFVLMLDEPTEGIQPSIIQDIEGVLQQLKSGGRLAILLVEQYLAFAQRLADYYYILDRGAVVFEGDREKLTDDVIRKYLTF
ncbi:MAG TPA: urea ABC transporter ATP-binding subunit UrtE [Lentisphaeria bacterium]|nr:urea ABC transporter ATP-binding subunit UrtE [Lentisphaeria bacterium]